MDPTPLKIHDERSWPQCEDLYRRGTIGVVEVRALEVDGNWFSRRSVAQGTLFTNGVVYRDALLSCFFNRLRIPHNAKIVSNVLAGKYA